MRLEFDVTTHTLYVLLPPEGTPGPAPFLPVPPGFPDREVFALLPVYRVPEDGGEPAAAAKAS